MRIPRIPPFFQLAIVITAALGCGSSRSTGSPRSPGQPLPENGAAESKLQGSWTMSLQGSGLVGHEKVPAEIEINGSHVLGKFAADKGKIDGELKGNVIEGSWEETDGNGNFRWVVSPDGKTFQGTFGGMLHSQKVPEGATWSGVHD